MFQPLNPPIPEWAGQRVWVVGASSGIGAALAQALQRAGARVAVSARRADALQAVIAATPPAPIDAPDPVLPARVLPLDINDVQSLEQAFHQLIKEWDGIDVIFWVAGIYQPMRAESFDLPQALRMLDTNLTAVFKGLSVLLPVLMRQGSGHLALVSSVAGFRGLPHALVYGPTKAAMINLAESLYLDLHPRGIGVSVINPGYVETPATAINDYPMPAIIPATEAARRTLEGVARGRFEVHYPRRFTLWLKFARLLPDRLYFALVQRVTGL
jgi:NAD(P)-dependent dehydrogenase (short-subunit alcohol dehydrogenase family)